MKDIVPDCSVKQTVKYLSKKITQSPIEAQLMDNEKIKVWIDDYLYIRPSTKKMWAISDIMAAVFEEIGNMLVEHNEVRIKKFGIFKISKPWTRASIVKGRNLMVDGTGVKIRKVHFQPCQELRRRIHEKSQSSL